MTLSDDLHDFVTDHGEHAHLTPATSPITPNGYRLEVACSCGVTFERWVTPWKRPRSWHWILRAGN